MPREPEAATVAGDSKPAVYCLLELGQRRKLAGEQKVVSDLTFSTQLHI